ncbi:MAG: prepilin-type N-terminal cleavage/methylation domain-containing protein [Bacilli bacterium]|jgi:type IV pilus assembly protein PilA
MRKNKGFTLVELLAVIVILAIILAVAIPGIGAIINSSKKSSYNSQMNLIKKAASLYMAKYSNGTTTSVRLDDLIEAGFIKDSVVNPVTNEAFDTNIIINTSSSGNISDYEVYEGPELVTGLIPVYYDETALAWKKADVTNNDYNWYDYNNQKWANAVTVTTGTRATYQASAVGATITEADALTYFVWIPRFKYMIPAGSGAREVKASFETKYTPKSTGDAVSTYYTHPAFTFGTEELNGIWVGKFETTGSSTAPTIKPDVQSLKALTVKAMYDSIKTYMQGSSTYGLSSDSDAHMMKNMEWGAAALLSGSTYGKYGNTSYTGVSKELYLNNSSGLYTGRSSGAPGGAGVLTPTYEYTSTGYYTYDGKCAFIYAGLSLPCASGSVGQALTNKNLAYGASTTGTIYGIYDMSGGAWDYVMGVYEPNPIPATGISDASGYSSTATDSQYNLLTINTKYYDRYLTPSSSTGAILGDATKETAGWYGDNASFVYADRPWFVRGGYFSYGSGAGAWSFIGYSGGVGGGVWFRVVLGPQS